MPYVPPAERFQVVWLSNCNTSRGCIRHSRIITEEQAHSVAQSIEHYRLFLGKTIWVLEYETEDSLSKARVVRKGSYDK